MMKTLSLRGKTCLVTGSTRGIGRAIAEELAKAGARVVISGTREQDVTRVVEEMRAEGAEVFGFACDVRQYDEVEALMDFAAANAGGLDILVNNAGIAFAPGDDRRAIGQKSQTRIMEMVSGQGVQTHLDITQNLSDESWRRMLAVHLDGTFFCTREALRLMSRRNRGAIINLSSVAALTGLETVPHYSAAKGGILAFTRAVAKDVASRGIRVNAICPGYIDTPMTESISPLIRAAVIARTPLGRVGDPQEVAATALFLASDDSSFFTGQWLSPNGGLFVG
jgi:3-oxoacyl-[acyl-carrier protein] reductase